VPLDQQKKQTEGARSEHDRLRAARLIRAKQDPRTAIEPETLEQKYVSRTELTHRSFPWHGTALPSGMTV